MRFGELWGVVFGTAVALAMVLGLFMLKRVLRRRLFSDPFGPSQDRAMTELLQLQARLQQELSAPGIESSETGDAGHEESNP